MSTVKDDDDDVHRSHRHGDMLKSYYGMSEDATLASGESPECDINGASFEPNAYLSRLLRERSLSELMAEENQMVRHIRSLDSDMQTLVYENYNKFISATDTIRKMKNDFRKMEDEMDHLSTNMAAITEFSGRISSTLQDRRQQITKLAGVHTLLKKLQFLFELPSRLKKCIDMQAYSQAVRFYMKARMVLHQYQHVTSLQNIQQDCNVIVAELSEKLREQFTHKHSSPKQLAECVDLLLQLDEPTEALCDEFLSHARQKLDSDLLLLSNQLQLLAPPGDEKKQQADILNTPMDVLEFVDCGCNGFLSNMCLVIASYNDMFMNRLQQQHEQLDAIALKKLVQFVNSLMEQYFDFVQQRVLLEKETGDNTILVRALDRFHRRLQAMNKLLPDTDFSRAGTEIVSRAARDRVAHYYASLTAHFNACLTDIRQQLAAPPHHGDAPPSLATLLQTAHQSLVSQVRSVLTNLRAFTATDATFAMQPYFRGAFCATEVRERLVVAFVRYIAAVADEWCTRQPPGGVTSAPQSPPPALLLVLSRLCVDFDESTVGYLLTLVDEQFMIDDKLKVTSRSELSAECRAAGQRLLNHYVRVQGLSISQMLRKSVDTRDWLHTIEPRTVRAVMKRVVEDVTFVDAQVGELYEDGTRAGDGGGSDSTARRSLSQQQQRASSRANWSYAPSTIDNSLMSNIQKLFSERIEIFSGVEFSKVSVLTGIIKISLKTLLECVRLRTFSRYGLQQIQVDAHYLQMYLWRFVSDENLVHFLLDEIVGSTIHRCLDAVTMEPSVSAVNFQGSLISSDNSDRFDRIRITDDVVIDRFDRSDITDDVVIDRFDRSDITDDVVIDRFDRSDITDDVVIEECVSKEAGERRLSEVVISSLITQKDCCPLLTQTAYSQAETAAKDTGQPADRMARGQNKSWSPYWQPKRKNYNHPSMLLPDVVICGRPLTLTSPWTIAGADWLSGLPPVSVLSQSTESLASSFDELDDANQAIDVRFLYPSQRWNCNIL